MRILAPREADAGDGVGRRRGTRLEDHHGGPIGAKHVNRGPGSALVGIGKLGRALRQRTLVLVLEVVSLIFTLPCSISKAVGKQFEILALILLRSAFKALADFPEPITITGHEQELWIILTDGGGAVVIFALLGVYRLLQNKLDETIKGGPTLFRFVAAKKMVALVILAIFIVMGVQNCLNMLGGGTSHHFFLNFYTVLIFSDIMLVLIAQRFLPEFRAVFRNSGFALATLLIRLALTAPPYYNVAIGIGAAIFACLLTLTYNTFYSNSSKYARRQH